MRDAMDNVESRESTHLLMLSPQSMASCVQVAEVDPTAAADAEDAPRVEAGKRAGGMTYEWPSGRAVVWVGGGQTRR